MSGHVHEHCRTPWTMFRKEGHLWMCSCGKVYRVTWYGALDTAFKYWSLVGTLEQPK